MVCSRVILSLHFKFRAINNVCLCACTELLQNLLAGRIDMIQKVGRKGDKQLSKLVFQITLYFGAGIIFSLILAHPVHKMSIIQEPNTLEL